MNSLHIQPAVILGAVIFTGMFATGVYFGVNLIDGFVMRVVAVALSLVVYMNVLKFFILEFYSVGESRMSEYLSYAIMYLITIGLLVLPFVTESIVVHDFVHLRYIMMTLAGIFFFKFFVYMVLGPLYDIRRAIRHHIHLKDKEYNPRVSVIIPAWNEGVGILHTIRSLLKSTYRNLEIVVINDGSTDNSDEVMRQFIAKYETTNPDISIVYQYQHNAGKGSALNHAVSLAQGEVIVSIDADCVVDPDAIAAFVETFKDESIMGAVGNVKIANKGNSVGLVQYLEFLFSFYFKRADALLGSIYIIGGAAGAFRREVFQTLGGYSTKNITEDIELTVRMQDAGMRIEYVPDALVYTEGAVDLASLKKQRLRWKRGRFETFYQYFHMFFSLRKRHNKFLTCIVMPLALLQELQLLLEIPFIVTLYLYSIVNNEFSSLNIAVFVVGVMFVVQFMFYDKSTRNLSFVLLAPIGWIIFYIATYVEAYALLKTIKSLIFRQEVTWQRWERRGIGHVSEAQ